jgi:hypothetical protein
MHWHAWSSSLLCPREVLFYTSSTIMCSSCVALSTSAVAFLLYFSRSLSQKCLLPLPLSPLFELYSKAGKLQKSSIRTLCITVACNTPPSLTGCTTSTSTSFASRVPPQHFQTMTLQTSPLDSLFMLPQPHAARRSVAGRHAGCHARQAAPLQAPAVPRIQPAVRPAHSDSSIGV